MCGTYELGGVPQERGGGRLDLPSVSRTAQVRASPFAPWKGCAFSSEG